MAAVVVLAALVCLVFQSWLKKQLEVLHLSISIVGGVASLFIAYYAYNIDKKVADNALREGRTGRSIALSESIINDHTVRQLIHDSIIIERAYAGHSTVSDIVKAQIDANLELLRAEPDGGGDFGTRIVVLLQHVARAAKCIGYDGLDFSKAAEEDMSADGSGFGARLYEVLFGTNAQRETTCDDKTFLALTGATLDDIYMAVRPVIACDKFFENEKTPGYMNIIYSYKSEEQAIGEQDDTKHIYVTRDSLNKAGVKPEDDYIVIEFDKDYCGYYKKKQSTDSQMVLESTAPLSRKN